VRSANRIRPSCPAAEYQPDPDYPLEPDVVATAELPAGDVWERLGTLYSNVAAQVAAAAAAGGRPVVMSGDCTTSLGTMAGLQRGGAGPGAGGVAAGTPGLVRDDVGHGFPGGAWPG
jgi:arginase